MGGAKVNAGVKRTARTCTEMVALLAPLAALPACALLQIEQSGLLTLIVGCAALAVFFCGFEKSRPALRQIMPTATLGALAAAGRVLFAPIPDFKPVSAICIIAGVVFGKHSGFMVGALAALCSNFFFGQGPWTPWQMYAWGLVGYIAGALAQTGVFELDENPAKPNALTLGTVVLLCYGFLSGLGYGFILNSWYIVAFLVPVTWQGALAAYLAGLPLDLIHSIATVIFLSALYVPWKRKLERIKRKFQQHAPDKERDSTNP